MGVMEGRTEGFLAQYTWTDAGGTTHTVTYTPDKAGKSMDMLGCEGWTVGAREWQSGEPEIFGWTQDGSSFWVAYNPDEDTTYSNANPCAGGPGDGVVFTHLMEGDKMFFSPPSPPPASVTLLIPLGGALSFDMGGEIEGFLEQYTWFDAGGTAHTLTFTPCQAGASGPGVGREGWTVGGTPWQPGEPEIFCDVMNGSGNWNAHNPDDDSFYPFEEFEDGTGGGGGGGLF